jgi:hypothetical protein
MKQLLTLIGLLGMLGFLLVGCASMQPLSNYARSGDTVAISLGGTDSNALVPVLKKGNIAVTITDSDSISHPVKLRNVIRLYSDPTSIFSYQNINPTNGYAAAYTEPHQGLWLAVLDLVDPSTGAPLPLAVGRASLSITSPDIQNWVDTTGYGWAWTNGDLSNIPIEILIGTGSPNPLNYLGPMSYAPMANLEAADQLEVTVQGTPGGIIGGATFVFQYENSSFSLEPRVTTTTPDPNVQLAWGSTNQGDGTSLLTVTVVNPHGFNVDNNGNSIKYNLGSSLLRSLRFNIVWVGSIVTDADWQDHIQLISSECTDFNGNRMPELMASVQKVK